MKMYYQEKAGRRYFRIWVPCALRPYLNAEIIYPIHSLDLQTACKRCRLLGIKLQQVFQQAASGLINMSILHPYIRELCANILYQDERNMWSGCTPPSEYEELQSSYEDAYREKDTSKADVLLQILKNQGLNIDPETMDTQAVIMNFYQGMIETCRILKERAAGNAKNGYDAPDKDGQTSAMLSKEDQTLIQHSIFDFPILKEDEINREGMKDLIVKRPSTPVPPCPTFIPLADRLFRLVKKPVHKTDEQPQEQTQPSAPASNAQPSVQLPYGIRKAICLSDGIEEFLKEKKVTRNMDRKTEYMRRNMLSVLVECFGAKQNLYGIDRSQILLLRNRVLTHYPVNRQKQENLKGKSLKELLAMNLPAISEKTQSHYMEEWNVFFNWAVQCGYMVTNPARGLQKKPDLADLTEERPPFTMEELKLIFTDLGKTQSSNQYRAFRYWIPLIGLYQGMRLNEICQLYLDDIIVEKCCPCIRIQANRERAQKVKNSSSIRTIPIHSTLLKLGFLDYCLQNMQRKDRRNDQLFEELTKSESGYQRKMQRFNARIHEDLKIAEKKTFHSFRHNFDTELSNKEPNAFLIQCLDGHARSGELGGRYSKGDLSVMRKTLEKVTYKGLNIFACLDASPLTEEQIAEQIQSIVKLRNK